jgi:hypothetical protein
MVTDGTDFPHVALLIYYYKPQKGPRKGQTDLYVTLFKATGEIKNVTISHTLAHLIHKGVIRSDDRDNLFYCYTGEEEENIEAEVCD